MRVAGMVLLIIVGATLTFWGVVSLAAPTVGDFVIALFLVLAGLALLGLALRASRQDRKM